MTWICRTIISLTLGLAFADANAQGIGRGAPISARGRVVGVFQDYVDSNFAFMVLDSGGHFVYSCILTNDTASVIRDLQPYIDRDVSISGSSLAPTIINRPFTGLQINLASPSSIKPLDSGDRDPFDIPVLDAALTTSELATSTPRKIRGTIAARWQKRKAILRLENGETMMAEFRDGTPLPQVGEHIEAAGIPVTDLYRTHLTRAFWRKAALAKPSDPEKASSVPLEKLFMNSGRFILNTKYYGRPVAVKGRARELVMDENGGRRLLIENGGLTVQIDCGDAAEALGEIEIGSLVSASGICVIDSEFWSGAVPFPRNKSLFIVARGNGDLQILARPPWWTPARLLIVIGILAFFASAVLVWNILLKKVSDRKGRDLAAARFANSVSELKVRERTRLATELHDSVVQILTGAIMKLRAADKMFESDPAASKKLLSLAMKTLDSCRDETRNCIWDLRNQALDEPVMDKVLVRALAPHAGDAKLTVRFAVPRDRLTDNTAHAIICATRELLLNAVRHGKAKSVQVAGCINGARLHFSVKDDGIGFNPATRPGPDEGHFGLQGVQERIEAIGGEVKIVSTPGAGTKVSASIAMPKEGRQ